MLFYWKCVFTDFNFQQHQYSTIVRLKTTPTINLSSYIDWNILLMTLCWWYVRVTPWCPCLLERRLLQLIQKKIRAQGLGCYYTNKNLCQTGGYAQPIALGHVTEFCSVSSKNLDPPQTVGLAYHLGMLRFHMYFSTIIIKNPYFIPRESWSVNDILVEALKMDQFVQRITVVLVNESKHVVVELKESCQFAPRGIYSYKIELAPLSHRNIPATRSSTDGPSTLQDQLPSRFLLTVFTPT